MKRKMTLRLFLLTILIALLWSCRSDDFGTPQSEAKRSNSDFFKHSKKGNEFARSGVDYIDILESYNNETDFLSTMPDQEGMPIWEKMRVIDTENSTGLIIPLSHNNETLSSVLFATLDSRNVITGVKDYDNNLLEKIIYDPRIDKDFRQGILTSYLVTDHYTFGTTEFTNLPYDLYIGVKHGDDSLRLSFNGYIKGESHNGQTEKLMISTTCLNIYHCKNNKPPDKCDGCSLCVTKTCGTEYIFTDDDSQFPPFPGNSGGGGNPGTPTQQPPKDPCTLSVQTFYRLKPGCLGTGGGIDLPPNPCRKLKDLLDSEKANLKPLITEGMYTHINNSTGEGGIYLQKDAAGNVATELAPYTAGSSIPIKSSGLYFSAMHTHPKSTFPMFSWTDIYNLYLLEMNAALPFNNGMSSFLLVCEDDNGVKQTYAIVFESVGTMMEDILTNPDNSGLTVPEICKRMDDALAELYRAEARKASPNYERVFLQFNFGTNIGLYKADDTLTNWSKLSINENMDTAIVNSVNCN